MLEKMEKLVEKSESLPALRKPPVDEYACPSPLHDVKSPRFSREDRVFKVDLLPCPLFRLGEKAKVVKGSPL